jgi:hypothetical protein
MINKKFILIYAWCACHSITIPGVARRKRNIVQNWIQDDLRSLPLPLVLPSQDGGSAAAAAAAATTAAATAAATHKTMYLSPVVETFMIK